MRNNLSEISPKLLESERVVGNNNVILENNKTKSQVILPLESSDYLDYFDGQHTVKEIIAEVFEKTGKVYFDSILKTVKTLNEKKFLEDISGEIINIGKSTNPHHQKSSTLIRSFKKFILIHKKKLGVDQPNIALGLCFIVLVGALYGAYFLLPNISFENFLKSEKDYSEALVNYFIIASILLSIRGLFKILFQILACTTLYGINLRINLFSVSVDVLNNSIYALKKKIYPIFYFLTNSGTFLFSATVFSLLSPGHPLVDDTFIIATLMSFNQLDPFRKSDFTSMFQFFYEDNQLESVSPYLKNNSFAGIFKKTSGSIDEIKYASYSFLAIAWAVGFILFSAVLVIQNFPSLILEIQIGNLLSQVSAFCVLALLGFHFAYLFFDLLHTLLKNFLSPILQPITRIMNRGKILKIEDEKQKEKYSTLLKTNIIFGAFDKKAIEFILDNSIIKKIKKGSYLAAQGESSHEVYFVLEGKLSINVEDISSKRKDLVELEAPCLIGESSLLKDSKRTANIIATTDLTYIEIKSSLINSLKDNEQFKQSYQQFIKRVELSQLISSAALFKDFPREIMNLFVEVGEMVQFPAGQNIIKQGESDKTFYLLVKGKVDVIKDCEKIAELKDGDYFGEIALLANTKRTATVKTTTDSVFLYIESDKFWKILIDHIELGIYLEMITKKRLRNESAS